MELLIIFALIFIIYGAGWIWQTVNDLLRDANRDSWESSAGAAPRAARFLLGGHDVADLGRAFQRFADDRRGELQPRELFETPKVSFVHHGARALLSLQEANDSGGALHTQITFTLPEGWSYRLEIFPQRLPAVASLAGDIAIGDGEFDPRYVVKSNDERFAREFLDGAARQAVEDLRNLLGNDQILVSMNSARLMVRKGTVIASSDDLSVFADLSGRLHDRIELFWQRASGIEILDEQAFPAESAPPVCQICGSKIPPESRVNCRRCGTPHHKDCWEFNGQCSTYACGEKRFASTKQ